MRFFDVRLVVALACGAVFACGARTRGATPDAGEHVGSQPDSATGSGISGVDAASLSPSCAAVLTCCPAIPQVLLSKCTSAVAQNTESTCSTVLGEYLFSGYISEAEYTTDAGCGGNPAGMAACSTLSECCSAGYAPPECADVANAGNGPACATEYAALWGEYCGNGPGP